LAACNPPLVNSHNNERNRYEYPVDTIGHDRSYRCGVLPAKNSIEDSPPPLCFVLWIATIDVPVEVSFVVLEGCLPDRSIDIVCTRATTQLCSITSNDLRPLICLDKPDTPRKQASGDQV
jgi:hypothetical protein